MNSLLGTRVLIRNQTRPLIVSAIISSTVTLGFGYVLLRWGGITGLAAATVVGSLSQVPYLYLVARKSFGAEMGPPVERSKSPLHGSVSSEAREGWARPDSNR